MLKPPVKTVLNWLGALGLSASLVACGDGGSTQLLPREIALVRASNFEQTVSLAGQVDGYVEFDMRRERDGALLRDPLNVLVTNAPRSEEEQPLQDARTNAIFTRRAVAFLGNGPDLDGNGTPDRLPADAPDPLDPLAPFRPPSGWNSRGILAYVPNQTTIPGRGPSQRFGVYVSSMIPFEGSLRFFARDEAGQVFASDFEVQHDGAPTQVVSVNLTNLVGSPVAPILITLCNQLGAGVFVRLLEGDTTTLSLPVGLTQDSSLSLATAYRAEAYQLDPTGSNLVSVSGSTANLSTPIGADGTASLSMIPVGSAGELLSTCTGDRILELRNVIPNAFRF